MTALPIRVGTRASLLARTQSELVADALRAPLGRDVELVEVTTEGDVSAAPLASIGGTGVFVSALRDALLRGDVDLAVHSLKDLPDHPARADRPGRRTRRGRTRATSSSPATGSRWASCPAGARVGTGSPRRAAQLHALGLGFDVVAIRGNVDTRIGKVSAGEVDAVVLARAGLARLGRMDEVTEVLDPLQMLPAPGQGALAVECRADGHRARAAGARRDRRPAHPGRRRPPSGRCWPPSRRAARPRSGRWPRSPRATTATSCGSGPWRCRADGAVAVRRSATGSPGDAEKVGRALAEEMLDDGASTLIEEQTS